MAPGGGEERFEEYVTFGPPSALLRISDFLADAFEEQQYAFPDPTHAIHGRGAYNALSIGEKVGIEAECRLDGMGDTALRIVRDPGLLKSLKEHLETRVAETVKPVKVKREKEPSSTKEKAKGKGKESIVSADKGKSKQRDQAEKRELFVPALARVGLGNIRLKSWPASPESHFYSRPTREDEKNTLSSVKLNPMPATDGSASIPPINLPNSPPIALITFTTYSRAHTYPHVLRRLSQHIILSTQTLQEVWNVIPCRHRLIPKEVYSDDGELVGFDASGEDANPEGQRVAIVIEDVVYGDAVSKPSYGDVVKEYVNKKGPGMVKRGPLMRDTILSDLHFRLHVPYWLLHQGECEHFITFDQIRLPHPIYDPVSVYPLTIQQSPFRLLNCHICDKRAAELSIIGDVRLGEGVCIVCKMCWGMLGSVGEGEDVLVVPLAMDGPGEEGREESDA